MTYAIEIRSDFLESGSADPETETRTIRGSIACDRQVAYNALRTPSRLYMNGKDRNALRDSPQDPTQYTHRSGRPVPHDADGRRYPEDPMTESTLYRMNPEEVLRPGYGHDYRTQHRLTGQDYEPGAIRSHYLRRSGQVLAGGLA